MIVICAGQHVKLSTILSIVMSTMDNDKPGNQARLFHLEDVMNTIQEFVEKRIHLAFERVPLPAQTRMTLHSLRQAFISSQMKISEGMGCKNVDDYITKPMKIDHLVQNRCLGEVMDLKSKEEYIQLVQQKMQEFWGITLTDEERIAHHLYTELLLMPFVQMVNGHLSSLA